MLEWLDAEGHVVTQIDEPTGGPIKVGFRNVSKRTLVGLVMDSGHPQVGFALRISGPYRPQLALGDLSPGEERFVWGMTSEGRARRFTQSRINVREGP